MFAIRARWFQELLFIGFLCLAANTYGNLSIDTKTLIFKDKQTSHKTFRDAYGREVYLRGWNTSGSVKLVETGFKPFRNAADAATSFRLMRQYTGSNMVRFTLAWEGTHPEVDTLDTEYLDGIAEQIRAAIQENIYVFLDFHVDLYSRHLFSENMPHTGNGAPQWIIAGADYPAAGCGIICFAWSQNNVTNLAVRKGYQYFFDNAPVNTKNGIRRVQDEFLWQLEQTLLYLKAKFSTEELAYITGVQPFNEPIYGKGHKDTAAQFDNEKLWPFYQKVRRVMDRTGWHNQWVYAEPMVFWDTNAGFFTPPTGGGYLAEKPGDGFVFAPHFYDAARMGVSNLNRVENADYFHNLEAIREEARFLDLPILLGEFGMWLGNQDGGHQDYVRMVKGVYQAMTANDKNRTVKDRYLDFATQAISGTQWHWDIYKDQHNELMNGNPNKIVTAGDGWNDEDFSAIKGSELTVNKKIIQQAFPRRIQGNLVSFYYNNLPSDGAGITPQWAGIAHNNALYFKHSEFLWVVWQGNNSEQPTEIFLPRHFDLKDTAIITEDIALLNLNHDSQHIRTASDNGLSQGGYVLAIDNGNLNAQAFHYALIVHRPELDQETINGIQTTLTTSVNQERSPVYLTGRMVSSNYPPEGSFFSPIEITAVNSYQFFIFRLLQFSWNAPEPVNIIKNGELVTTGSTKGSGIFWSKVGAGDNYLICLQSEPETCSKALSFH